MSGEKILVIDDRRENLLFLANSVLRPEGYEVITAIDGKQGFDKALAERPDLIITDLRMPRMSGLELMAALRKAEVCIPVILTTFYGSEQAAIQAFRLGAKDYIVKPYEISEMLDSVERALVEQRLRRQTSGLREGIEASQQLEERVRQLNSLCGIAKALMGVRDAEEVMRIVVEAALYVTGANAGQLFVVDDQTQTLELRVVRGPSDSRARSLRQRGADPITIQVAETGRAVIGERDSGGRDKLPCLVMPVRTGNNVVGVLGVDGKPNQPFNENDRYHMGILADFGGAALASARHFERLKSQPDTASEASEAPDTNAPPWSAPDLSEAAAEAENLARQLQDLSTRAKALVDQLQIRSPDR